MKFKGAKRTRKFSLASSFARAYSTKVDNFSLKSSSSKI